jgi:hypothetical protein
MLSNILKTIDSAIKNMLKKLISFFMMIVILAMGFSVQAFAQPTVGKNYKDYLAMGSGSSVALPEGNWLTSHATTWTEGTQRWNIYTLKNLQPNPSVAFLVVRQATLPKMWGNTNCAQKRANVYFYNEHGTTQSSTLNKCSRNFAFANSAPLIDVSYPNWSRGDKDWWLQAAPGLKDLSIYGNGPMFVSELEVQQYNGYRIRIEALIPPPKGFSLKKFREDMDAGTYRPEAEIFSLWNSIYIESIYQSFFEKKPQPIFALAVPWINSAGKLIQAAPLIAMAPIASERVKAADLPANKASTNDPFEEARLAASQHLEDLEKRLQMAFPSAQEQVSKPQTSKPQVAPAPILVVTAPAKGPSVQVAPELAESKRIEQERKQLEEEKSKVSQQLEDMRQLLTKLQKENEMAAARQAEVAKAKLLESSVPPKPVVYANRKALVIGNDLYTNVSKLNNAGADANAMAIALEQVGYKVYKHLNVDEKKFKQVIREFRSNVQGGDEVLVYYAGHGVQIGSNNYLLPIDIKGEQEEQVKDEAILLQKILDELEEKKTKFALAVIDACRDNPFKTKGRALGGRGLAPTSAASGQMVMFSAGSGQQALDRLGEKDTDKNGLFTRIFVKEMMKPGVPVDRVLRNVRTEVVRLAKSVGHEQTPALYDQAIGEFYFRQ